MGKFIIIAIIIAVALCLVFVAGAAIVKASDKILEFKDLDVNQLAVQGFEMKEGGAIEVTAIGGKAQYSEKYFAYGWIIEADSRELVWSMQNDCDETDRISDYLNECQSSVRLRPGKYEAYYFAGSSASILSGGYDVKPGDLGELVKVLGDIVLNVGKDRDFQLEDVDQEELGMSFTTDLTFALYTPLFASPENSVVYINQPEANEYLHEGFTLSRESDLKIYALGEYSDSYEVFVDGAWIVNASTREKVWTMDKWNTDRAGGASKNRVIRDVITLPPGNYVAYYATDDSHDAKEWNSPPPADPLNYGLAIAALNAGDMKFVSAYDDTHSEVEIARLVRIRDGAFEKAGFTLKHDATIHIFALGERSYSDNELADYGWITDVESMERVWEMTSDNTGYAGGAAKNCMFDGMVDLPAGNYMLYFRTDDSHAFGDWNDSPPFDKRNYGISLFGVGDAFTANSFAVVDHFAPGGKVLVDLSGLGNYEEINRSFSLDKDTDIRVIALGEGKSRVMYDYGWIENSKSGEIVWEMTYRKTRHAGGADKNRMAVANLTLAKGDYTAHFITDDSHSLESFNASPPDEPERWGMVITLK